jgi:hypothetical protein
MRNVIVPLATEADHGTSPGRAGNESRGSSLCREDAKATMEWHGFKCEFDRDWQGERSMDADSAKYGEAYLICSKMKPQRTWKESLYLSDEIKVFFSFRDGKVVGVRVKHIPCCL